MMTVAKNHELNGVVGKIQSRLRPGQTPEQRSEEIKKLVRRWAIGFDQELTGQFMAKFAEDFLDFFDEDARNEIEEVVKELHALKDFNRFRRKMLWALSTAFSNGVANGKEGADFDLQEFAERIARGVHEEHKEVLKPIPEKK